MYVFSVHARQLADVSTCVSTVHVRLHSYIRTFLNRTTFANRYTVSHCVRQLLAHDGSALVPTAWFLVSCYFFILARHIGFLLTPGTPNFDISGKQKLIAISGQCKVDATALYILFVNAFLLPGKNGSRSPGPGMHLIQHHVLQLLIVHRAKIDVGF